MSAPTRVMLLIDGIQFTEGPRLWWKEGGRVEELFRLVREAGLWLGFDHYGRRGSARLKHARSETELVRGIAAFKQGLYSVQAGNEEEPECEIVLTLDPGALALRYLLSGDEFDARRRSIVSQFIELTRLLHESWHDSALFGPQLCIDVRGISYPHVRPPRFKLPWTFGNAADMICLKFHKETDEGSTSDVERMLKAPMPRGAKRERKGDLVVLLWADDLSDGKKVAARLSAQEQWLVNVLDPPLHPDYNKHGDYRESPMSLRPQPPLTFYDPVEEAGYKTVATAPGGGLDAELWDELKELVEAGQLPDKTPLRYLNLILPNRKAALRVHERAVANGLNKVFYIDDEGELWNPFPPGQWIE